MSRSGAHNRTSDVNFDTVKKALIESKGSVARAARQLHCSRGLIALRIKKDDTGELKAALDDARHAVFDEIENALIENALAGNIIAQIFFLKTQGTRLGRPYVEMKAYDDGRESVSQMTLEEWKVKQQRQIGQVQQMLEDFSDYGGEGADLDVPPGERVIDVEPS